LRVPRQRCMRAGFTARSPASTAKAVAAFVRPESSNQCPLTRTCEQLCIGGSDFRVQAIERQNAIRPRSNLFLVLTSRLPDLGLAKLPGVLAQWQEVDIRHLPVRHSLIRFLWAWASGNCNFTQTSAPSFRNVSSIGVPDPSAPTVSGRCSTSPSPQVPTPIQLFAESASSKSPQRHFSGPPHLRARPAPVVPIRLAAYQTAPR